MEEGTLIIAMKGLPCTGKTRLANMIADSLQCPVISQHDVVDTLSSLLLLDPPPTEPSSTGAAAAAQLLHDQSYYTLWRITSLQLKTRKPTIVIDSPLCCPTDFIHLLQVLGTGRAYLILVDCKPRDKFEWRQWADQRLDSCLWYKPSKWEDIEKLLLKTEDYDTSMVSKLVVDTTKYVKKDAILDVLSRLAQAAPAIHCVQFHDWLWNVQKGNIAEYDGLTEEEQAAERSIYLKEPEYGESHLHEFLFSDNFQEKQDDLGHGGRICRGCLEPIIPGSPAYRCKQCHICLHQSCVELQNMKEIRPPDHPTFLREIQLNNSYFFRKPARCERCASYDDDLGGIELEYCTDCLFESYIRSAELPCVLQHPCHKHLLHVYLSPVSFEAEFKCHVCGELGRHVYYYCHDCFFECHLGCALLPYSWKQERHRHVLTIASLAHFLFQFLNFRIHQTDT